MQLRRTLALSASALVLCAACGESHMGDEDAAIVFDATFPDAGTDAGPPPSNVGAACASDEDCASSGPADRCITELGGYCSAGCTTDEDCPTGSACVDLGSRVCLALCNTDSPDDQCGDGLGCIGGGPGLPPVCLPGCETDAECGDGLVCALGGGEFGAGACIDPDAPLGSACTSDADCPPSAICAGGPDYPGGTCLLLNVCDSETNDGCPDDAQCIPLRFTGDVCFDGCSTDGDCRSGWECTDFYTAPGRLACRPIFDPVNLGGVCDDAGACPGGECVDERFDGWPASYCADFGCDPEAASSGCPGDGVCAPTTGGGGACLDGCASDADCRTAYRCRPVDRDDPESPSACFPGCTDDSQCTETFGRSDTPYVCNPGTGYCTRPLDPEDIGEPCAGGFFECRGGICMTEDGSGWPAGACAYPGCRLSGTGPAATCPTGTACTDDDAGDPELGICVDACTVGSTSCRAGYACVALADGGTEGACRPACTDSVCASCNESTGLCE